MATKKSKVIDVKKSTTKALPKKVKNVKYETVWRNKWITSDAKTIDDMIKMLRESADYLEAMKNDGVTLSENSGIVDDYADLITTDKAIAEKYGFHPPFEE